MTTVAATPANAQTAPAPVESTALGQLFMLALCVIALATIVVRSVFRLDPEVDAVLDGADRFICVVFALDFVVSLWRAPDRLRYLVTWGWLDLLSSIPTLDIARWGRVARIARILRILRGIRAARVLSVLILHKRSQSTFLAATLLALVLVVASSTAILHFETVPDSNIRTSDDALWWAFATITTVGYGDRFPVTMEGRLIAALLMTAGVGLFGAFSATLAAWFLVAEEEAAEAELGRVREELAALRAAVESLAKVTPPK